MANIRFIIRNMDAYDAQTIYVTARFGRNEKLMYALPLRCEPLYWDAERGRVRPSAYCSYRDEVNDGLDGLERLFRRHAAEVSAQGGDLSKKGLVHLLDVHFGKARGEACDFHSFFRWFIEDCKTRTNSRRGGQVLTYYTMREYARTLIYIEEYERDRGVRIEFGDVAQDFLADFVAYLQGRNKATNTIAHKVISIKAVMRAAVMRGLTDNERWRYFRNSTEETDAVALSEDELERLRRHDFSYSPRLERVRDLFLAGCWTGLRFSDVTRIRRENIRDGFITITQSKTNEPVSIPVHPVFQEIWERCGGSLPSDISNQKFNEYVKEVCRAVGLRERVLKSITRGGRKQTESREKWELVSAHTARRTFATNLYLSGFPSISIMRITGHKTETAFLRYIKVSQQEHARMLADHWRRQRTVTVPLHADRHLVLRSDPRVFVTQCPDGSVVLDGRVMSLSEATERVTGSASEHPEELWVLQ